MVLFTTPESWLGCAVTVGGVALTQRELREEKKLILCSGECHALISSPASLEDWAAKII